MYRVMSEDGKVLQDWSNMKKTCEFTGWDHKTIANMASRKKNGRQGAVRKGMYIIADCDNRFIAKSKYPDIVPLFEMGVTSAEIARRLNISYNSIYNMRKEWEEKTNNQKEETIEGKKLPPKLMKEWDEVREQILSRLIF